MAEVWFYHLERSAAEPVLAELLDKTLQRGWRAMVRAADRDRLTAISAALWAWRPDSFLAHGVDDEPSPERQPILLTDGEERLNDADALFLLDGAEAGALNAYQRCVVIFDGRDEDALGRSRALWTSSKADGHSISYWQQGEQGWAKRNT